MGQEKPNYSNHEPLLLRPSRCRLCEAQLLLLIPETPEERDPAFLHQDFQEDTKTIGGHARASVLIPGALCP